MLVTVLLGATAIVLSLYGLMVLIEWLCELPLRYGLALLWAILVVIGLVIWKIVP